MHHSTNKADGCTYDCTFCGHIFPSETLTQVVVPADADEPEMLAQVCSTCLEGARARGALPTMPAEVDLSALRSVFDGLTLAVERWESEFGTPRPAIVVHAQRRPAWSTVAAALHTLAAIAMAEMPARAGWTPELSDGLGFGCVYLELLNGTEAEAERGLAFLRGLAARLVRTRGR